MVTAFIDESGNLGTADRYFVLAAVVCSNDSSKNRIKRIMKKACLDCSSDGKPLEEIKSSELNFTQKQKIVNKLVGKADHEVFILVCDKNHIEEHLKDKKNIIYNYLSGFLVKRIVRKYNDDVRIIFDERSTKVKSMNSLLEYLQTKVHIEWGFTKNFTVEQSDSKSMYCLQAADLVSNITFRKYERGKSHLLELLDPRIESVVEFPFAKFGK